MAVEQMMMSMEFALTEFPSDALLPATDAKQAASETQETTAVEDQSHHEIPVEGSDGPESSRPPNSDEEEKK